MNKKIRISLLAILLLAFQVTFSQVDNELVELDEIVLTIPFDQTVGKSILKVDKLNFDNVSPIIAQYMMNSISKLPGVSSISTGPGIGKPTIRGLSFNRVVVIDQGIRLENQQWVLMDYVDVVVHIFQKNVREFYDIENLWGDAKISKIKIKA